MFVRIRLSSSLKGLSKTKISASEAPTVNVAVTVTLLLLELVTAAGLVVPFVPTMKSNAGDGNVHLLLAVRVMVAVYVRPVSNLSPDGDH